jgi:hypothetical protein
MQGKLMQGQVPARFGIARAWNIRSLSLEFNEAEIEAVRQEFGGPVFAYAGGTSVRLVVADAN